MKIPVLDMLRHAGARLARRTAPKAIVLLYHRVADLRPDPWSLCVAPSHFAEHLDVLRQCSNPLRLQELVQALDTGRLSPRAVVVTFDDGYADNLHHAKPALERHDIPATVFITTGNIGQAREFWWDELERLLLQPGILPGELRLCIDGVVHQWNLAEATHYSDEDVHRDRDWIAWGETHPTARHQIYYALWEKLHPLPEDRRRDVLAEIADWSHAAPNSRLTHRSLDRAGVIDLARGGLVEVGAHTVTHPTLSALSAAAQRDEISASKALLEQVVDQPIVSFSYPFGRRTDYSDETVSIVRQAGFTAACSNFAGVVGHSTDRFQIPRVNVPDCDGDMFARQLASWFDS